MVTRRASRPALPAQYAFDDFKLAVAQADYAAIGCCAKFGTNDALRRRTLSHLRV
jgi:hypothetical protein